MHEAPRSSLGQGGRRRHTWPAAPKGGPSFPCLWTPSSCSKPALTAAKHHVPLAYYRTEQKHQLPAWKHFSLSGFDFVLLVYLIRKEAAKFCKHLKCKFSSFLQLLFYPVSSPAPPCPPAWNDAALSSSSSSLWCLSLGAHQVVREGLLLLRALGTRGRDKNRGGVKVRLAKAACRSEYQRKKWKKALLCCY